MGGERVRLRICRIKAACRGGKVSRVNNSLHNLNANTQVSRLGTLVPSFAARPMFVPAFGLN